MDLSSLRGYTFRYCNKIESHNKKANHLKAIHIYTFRNHKRQIYIVNVEQFDHNVYVVKFFLKRDSSSQTKYNILLKEDWHRARKVIYTCVEIGLEIYAKNPLASFGFVGSPTISEIRTTQLERTKRFRVYQYFAAFFFSPENFTHSFLEQQSSYLLLNNTYKAQYPDALPAIKDMFKEDIASIVLPVV